MDKVYICIDLKSFYASVECIERGLEPMKTNLIVADSSRTEKTICLAVTPALKSFGIPGRPRLFEVVQRVKTINNGRLKNAPFGKFSGESYNVDELAIDPSLELSYIIAPPRMAYYMEYSTRIYNIYLKYVSEEDILVYSIDEVFIDITGYLSVYKTTPRKLAEQILADVYSTTGITATVGIGTNLYLAKIAMDVKAKKIPADKNGARIAELNEESYRREMWEHRPLTDFWRVGKGTAKKLEANYMYTMGDVAKASLTSHGRVLLKKLFGINAKLLIDHAWGYEPCTIKEAKAYTPETTSINSGQVLHCPYDYQKTEIIVREMTELIVLELVEKRLVTDQFVLTIGYDIENLTNEKISKSYSGEVVTDMYGRSIPKHAHGTVNLEKPTSSTMLIMKAVMELFERITDKNLLVRRINISANRVVGEGTAKPRYEQIDLFSDINEEDKKRETLQKERKLQEATIELRNRFGKNAVLKGTNLREGATTVERNRQIGGHKA